MIDIDHAISLYLVVVLDTIRADSMAYIEETTRKQRGVISVAFLRDTLCQGYAVLVRVKRASKYACQHFGIYAAANERKMIKNHTMANCQRSVSVVNLTP